MSDLARRTPPAWRAIALGTLFGGFAAGWKAPAARVSVGLAAAVLAAYVLPIARASRRPPIEPDAVPLDPAASPPTFSVVVAARDEARVLPRLVGDLAAQDHRALDGTPLFDILVVDDRSTDGTAEAAMAAARRHGIEGLVRVVRRDGIDLPDGKGAALTAAQPHLCRGEVVVVLDADAQVRPSFLRHLASYIAAGADAVTARRCIVDAGATQVAGAQADEQTVDGEIQRGRWAMGGCSEFRGNGIVLRRELLEAVGGWRAQALTEDLDLSSRVAALRGTRVAWAIDAEVWEEPVLSFPALWRQRVRWAEGSVRRTLEHGPQVVTSAELPLAARLDFAAYAGQLAIPPILIGTLAAGAWQGRPAPAIRLVGAYLAAGGILAWDALRWEERPDGTPLSAGERAWRALRVTIFGGVWMAVIPAALWRLGTRRGRVRYDKMPHLGLARPAWSRWQGAEAAVAAAPTDDQRGPNATPANPAPATTPTPPGTSA